MTNRTDRTTAALLVACMVAACSTSELLEVETPDQITPDKAGSAVGAAALRASAIGNFAAFYGGDYGGSFHGVSITSGMLTDEIESARGGTEHLDSRAQNEGVQPLSTTWAFVGQSTTQTIRAIKALKEFAQRSHRCGKGDEGHAGRPPVRAPGVRVRDPRRELLQRHPGRERGRPGAENR